MDFSDWLRKASGRKQLSGNGNTDSSGSDSGSGSLYSGDSMFSIAPMQPTDTPNFSNPPLSPADPSSDAAASNDVPASSTSEDNSSDSTDAALASDESGIDDIDTSSEEDEAMVLDDGDEVSLDDTGDDISDDESGDSVDDSTDDTSDESIDENGDESDSNDTEDQSAQPSLDISENPAPITIAAANQDGQGESASQDEDAVDSAAEKKAIEDVATQASIALSNQQVAQAAADQVAQATDAESAQNAADAAQTAADAAQAAADQAQSDADTAQEYADQHPDDADAQIAAANAQSVADSAQSTADTVQTVADTAEDTASNFPDEDSTGATSDPGQSAPLGSTNNSGNERQGQAFSSKDNKDGSTDHVYASGETVHVSHEGTVAPTMYNNKGQAVYTNHTIGSDHYGELYTVTQDSSGNVVHEYANHDKVVMHHPNQTGGTSPPAESSAPTTSAEQAPVATAPPASHQEAPAPMHQEAAPVAVSGTVQPDVSAAPTAEDHAVQPTATDTVYENEDTASKFYHHRFVVKDLGGGMQRHVYWNIGEHEDMQGLGNAKLIAGAPAEATPPPAPNEQPAPVAVASAPASDPAPAPAAPAPYVFAGWDSNHIPGDPVGDEPRFMNDTTGQRFSGKAFIVRKLTDGREAHIYYNTNNKGTPDYVITNDRGQSHQIAGAATNGASIGGVDFHDTLDAGLGMLPHASSYHHSPKISDRSGAVIGGDQEQHKQLGGWAAASSDTPLDPGNAILATGEHIDTDPMSGNAKGSAKN
jgi:hypothetical protein